MRQGRPRGYIGNHPAVPADRGRHGSVTAMARRCQVASGRFEPLSRLIEQACRHQRLANARDLRIPDLDQRRPHDGARQAAENNKRLRHA